MKTSIRVSHHRFTGTTRHSPRNGLRLLRDLPGDRAFLPPSSANDASTNLTPASGSQNHTTWPSAFTPFVIGTTNVHASRPAFCDDRETPLSGTGRGSM